MTAIFYTPLLVKEPFKDGKGSVYHFRLEAFTLDPSTLRPTPAPLQTLGIDVQVADLELDSEDPGVLIRKLESVANRCGARVFSELIGKVTP